MSERTPTVAEMRDAWITAQTLRRETFAQHYRGAPVPDYGAEFDRGIAVIESEARAEGAGNEQMY